MKKLNTAKALKLNAVIGIFWWFLFYPGFYSPDSLYFVAIARDEIDSSTVSTLYQIYLKVFTLSGEFIPLITLVNVLILTYATTHFFFSTQQNSVAGIGSSILCGTPLIGAIGVTLWQDVPFAAGFILLASFFSKRVKAGRNSSQDFLQLFIPGVLCVNLRPNGFVTILILGLLLLVFFKKKFLKTVVTMYITSATLSLGFPLIQGVPLVDRVYAQEWMRYDVMCYLGTTSRNDLNDFSTSFPGDVESWKSKEACTWFAKTELSGQEIKASTEFIPTIWREILIKEPSFIFKTHIDRHSYLIPLPLKGLPNPPFIHSVIDRNNYNLNWPNEDFTSGLRILPRIWNYFNFFFAWSGLWWVIILLLFVLRRQAIGVIPFLISTSTTLILLVFAPISDARYTLHILIMGQALLLQNILEWFLKRYTKVKHGS